MEPYTVEIGWLRISVGEGGYCTLICGPGGNVRSVPIETDTVVKLGNLEHCDKQHEALARWLPTVKDVKAVVHEKPNSSGQVERVELTGVPV